MANSFEDSQIDIKILEIINRLKYNKFPTYLNAKKSWGIAFPYYSITEDLFPFSPSLTYKIKKARDFLPIDGDPLSPQFILNYLRGKWILAFEFYSGKHCLLDPRFSWTIILNIFQVRNLLEELIVFNVYVYDISGGAIFPSF